MNATETKVSVSQLLRIAAGLWLGYLLVLAVIDWNITPPNRQFAYGYYVVNGLTALIILGLALWERGQEWLGRAFLPFLIILMTVLPTVSKYLLTPESLPGPIISVGAFTVLLLALVLTAWQYSWRHVAFFCLGTALLNLGILVLAVGPLTRPFFFELLGTAIQTISFVVVGYFINALITQLRIQQDTLEQANTQLAHYASTLEHLTISRERNRMARELHDTLAHTLSALTVQLETVKAYWDVDASAAQTMLDRSLDATRSGLQETRRALKSLRATPLDDLGLSLALSKMAKSAAHRANLTLDLAVSESIPSMSPDVEQGIYRVAQEAVANVTHHANAQNLKVHLTANGHGVSLLVQDDGRGFKPQPIDQTEHFGLAGMRERAQLAGGQLAIESQPGRGTTIRLTIKDVDA
ncbi:MAG TPA: sensor histidine kinase [Anaerolineae bacterium]|nr:sensor histidine kinase [Anaerolineae bacterium]MCB9107371.1 sensor histidine kinase [Anaerolineales bacterium]HRV95055.1 sensor histidine kinase [Anaerolineae bacterium]